MSRVPKSLAARSRMLAKRAQSGSPYIRFWNRYGDGERDQTQSRGKKTLQVGGHTPLGGLGYDPRITWAWMVRRALKPIRISKTTVYDAHGKAIAEIVVDPITGRRERKPLP